MIEGGSLPGGLVVAEFAIGGEARALVVGVGRSVVILEVAGGAIPRRPLVSAPRVAFAAVQGLVGAEEPVELVVVEFGSLPGGLVVADLTLEREARRLVVGIGGVGVILDMTGCAVLGGPLVEPALVAFAADEGFVGSPKGEGLVVIEIGAPPAKAAVTKLAVGGKACGLVVGVGGPVVVGKVAARAVFGGPSIDPLVAGAALQTAVPSLKGEEGSVVKVRTCPAIGRVAALAVGPETGGGVLGLGRGLVVLLVAIYAVAGGPLEDITLVAFGAAGGFVHTDQGEAVVVKACVHPGRGDVTALAVVRPPLGHVVGILGSR